VVGKRSVSPHHGVPENIYLPAGITPQREFRGVARILCSHQWPVLLGQASGIYKREPALGLCCDSFLRLRTEVNHG